MLPLLLLVAVLLPIGMRTEDIIGGQEARPHSRPYMAYVQFLHEHTNNRCGGVLVREDFVLTAAHCNGSATKVTLGAHNIKKKEKTQQVFKVTKAIPHPDYNPETFANDIMLLQLQRNIKFTKAVKPLRLPKGENQVRPGQKCIVAGWGQNELGILANTLQEVKLTIQKDRECKSRFSSYYSRDTQICVGDPKKRMAGFKGDSGGPLMCNNVPQGIFSYGKKTPPGVYMNVSYFLTWIKRTMKRL